MADTIYECPDCNSRQVSDRKTKYKAIGWTLVVLSIIGASVLVPLLLLPVGLFMVGFAFFIPKNRVLTCKECSNRFSIEQGKVT